jgi:hypothetical protein
MAGLASQLPGVWISKETGFIPRLHEPGTASITQWDDARLAPLIESVNSYLTMGHWEALATVADAREFWSATGSTGYAGLVRYVWSLEKPEADPAIALLGDQTPNYVLALPLLEQLFPDAFYVHVVRDPRDVVASILPLRFGARSVGVAASDWNECVAGWWAAERRIPPERRFEVRYEDLVRDPTGARQRLGSALGRTGAAREAERSLPNDPHGLAGLAPHHGRLAGPIDDSSVGRHHRDLSDPDRSLVEAITYAGLVTYGYDAGPFRPSPVLEEDVSLLTRERLRDLRRRAAGRLARRRPRPS